MIEKFEAKVLDPAIYSISLVGMGKNSGKTVTLNYLISILKGKTLGVTSIGIDGEKIDNLTYTPKPAIRLERGTYLATASETLKEFTSSYEILEGTGIFNPLGEILIVRLLEEGEVLIGGPERNTDLIKVIDIFKKYQCEKVLVDGAIDRRASASPYVTDGLVFVTGASFSRDINRLIKETVHKINMLSLPATNVDIYEQLGPYFSKDQIVVVKDDTVEELPFKSAFLAKEITKFFSSDAENTLFIPGALMDSLIIEIIPLIKKGYRLRIVVKDGTRVFLTPKVYQKLIEEQGRLEVCRKSEPLGLAVNPVSIEGYEFDSDTLVNRLRMFVAIPVIDPLR